MMTAGVRWANRGLRALERAEGDAGAGMRARLLALLAGFRSRQGRLAEAEKICRMAMLAAEQAGELRALATACYVLDWALVEQGRAEQAIHSPRALEIFRALGDPEQEATVLNNLGMFAYYRGAWDEAIASYRACAECCARAGNQGDAGAAEVNVGEILSDQGHYEQARRHLRRAERMFSSMGEPAGVIFVRVLRGRLELRSGNGAPAIAILADAARETRDRGIDPSFSDAVLAEAVAAVGDPGRALELAAAVLRSGDRHAPVGLRSQAIALWRAGDGAAAALKAREAVAAARALGAGHDVAAGLDALDAIDGLDPAGAAELRRLSERLGLLVLARPWAVGEAGAPGAMPDAPAREAV
jgi:tetratricopeptide (TPR) repeat protein